MDSRIRTELETSPNVTYVRVKAEDVDDINYFQDNIGEVKEIIERDKNMNIKFAKVFKYNSSGDVTSEAMDRKRYVEYKGA